MINRQANTLLISSSINSDQTGQQASLKQPAYSQQLIRALLARHVYTIEGFQYLGRRLAAIARYALLSRQMDVVEQVSQIMLALPISDEFRNLGLYYRANSLSWQKDFNQARQLFESIVEKAKPEYRARTLQCIGATYFDSGQPDAALPFYISAGKIAANCDLLTLAESQRMIAVVRSIHGDHKQALALLENLFPLVRAIGKYYPAAYYVFLNSFAVELGEVGHINEAKAVCSIVLASPFASAYPECAETRDELEAKRTSATPSVVAFNQVPEAKPAPKSKPKENAARIKAIAFFWVLGNQTSQIAITPIAVDNELNQITLAHLGKSVRARAPPAHS
ncbi:MAG TPA: tetratricopeptide repeat protein [Blastocatellia bacterium]|nr:tetratricopeptide repeat protein [Blastocatellia bacterium]